MTPEYWQRLDALFCEAVELPRTEQTAFLDRECTDAEMRAELASMLKHDTHDNDNLRASIQTAAQEVTSDGEDPWLGTVVGPYRIVEKIAEGGMGAVYLGERDDDQFRQRVAVKLLSSGLISGTAKKRFLSERQILANLNHPNIAQLLDGGTADNGVPYLVMEYIEGVPIDEYCDRERLTTHARLELLREVCGAVQYAHRNLIVHRDIKPGNILVTADGVPKLLDFGIAKLLDERDAAHTIAVTRADMRLLTPEYSSPEQVRGEPVTTATDVYALGVLMYQLLTGAFPYRLTSFRPGEVERVICETEPERPSTMAARADPETVGRNRRSTPARLRRRLRGDLDNIILAAMRKEPERRYGTVRTMSEDIRNYLEDLPVLARADTFHYRTSKFVSRYRFRLVIAAIAVAIVAGVVGFYTWRLALERDLVIKERDTAERTADFLVRLFEESDPEISRGQATSAREILDRGAQEIGRGLTDEPVLRARLMYTMARVYFGLGQFDEAGSFVDDVVDELQHGGVDSELQMADAYVLQGNILTARNEFEKARQLFEQGLAIYRREAGENSVRTLKALIDIGEMQYRYGGTEEAIRNCELADRALAGATETERRTLAARAKICLGRSYLVGSRPDDAQPVLEAGRAILIDLHGTDHPDVAEAEHELGAVQHYRGNYPGAKDQYARSLDIMRRVYGNDHVRLVTPLTEMADVGGLLGEYEQAEVALDEAAAIVRANFGNDHTLIGVVMHIRGNVMLDQGRNAEGEQMFRESLAIMERLLDPAHEHIPMLNNALASALQFQGKYEDAERHFRVAVTLSERNQGTHYLDTIIHVSNLGGMLASIGKYEEALPYIEDAVERGTATMGAEHPDVVIFRHAHGKALGYLGRHDEAVATLDEVGEAFLRIYGEGHWRYASWTSDRGQLCLAMGDLECAAEYLDRAAVLKRAGVGENHNSYAITLYETARLNVALGDSDEAHRLVEQALAIMRSNELPESHISQVRARELLARL